jgi:hypothetical protein
MCVGQAISKQDAAPFLARAQRAEDQLAAQQAAPEQAPEVGVTRQPPVAVHVHLPSMPAAWTQLPVIDALPAPIDLDALTANHRTETPT